MSPSTSPSASESSSVSPSTSPSSSPSDFTPITGSTTWGHVTGVVENNIRTFNTHWTGTGTIELTGDAERVRLDENEYMESEVVETGIKTVRILQNHYLSGNTIVLKYRHGIDKNACLIASWNSYSSPFGSLGYVQVRIEYLI